MLERIYDARATVINKMSSLNAIKTWRKIVKRGDLAEQTSDHRDSHFKIRGRSYSRIFQFYEIKALIKMFLRR